MPFGAALYWEETQPRKESSAWPLIKHKCRFVRPWAMSWTSASQKRNITTQLFRPPRQKANWLSSLVGCQTCAPHTLSSLSIMLKPCQLVSGLGGTGVYKPGTIIMWRAIIWPLLKSKTNLLKCLYPIIFLTWHLLTPT